MHAVRNIRLCTKDCLCLYVCPTGATDTETGQIDATKCLSGCRACVDACPSHAIALVPATYPEPKAKNADVAATLRGLAVGKIRQAQLAAGAAQAATAPGACLLADAVSRSCRLSAEDLLREAGYLLPQSAPVRELLGNLLQEAQPADFPADAVRRLLVLLEQTET